jgi:hypothetical protein
MSPQTKKVAAALADAILMKMHQLNLVAAADSWRTGAVRVQDEEQEPTEVQKSWGRENNSNPKN